MLPEIETEYKYLLGEQRFMELLEKCDQRYPFSERRIQVNYYYDTDGYALNQSHTTVRIRQQYQKLTLQIKSHRATEGSMALSDEYSERMDQVPLSLRIPSVEDPLSLKGSLVTERTVYSFGENGTICFDVNLYLGVCDYEIEVEFDQHDSQEAVSVIEYLGLEQIPVTGKSRRFFERLRALKREQNPASLH